MSGWGAGLLAGAVAGSCVIVVLAHGPLLEPGWAATNLGASRWLFLAVGAGFVVHLVRLVRATRSAPDTDAHARVAGLDQLTEIWIHLFVGIGVVWTAIGMRYALAAALAVEAADAAVPRAPDDVLRALVDGGILVALTSTVVGGLGGYAMKLLKALVVGRALQRFYGAHAVAGLARLEEAVGRIAGSMAALQAAAGARGRSAASRPRAPEPGPEGA